jgi:hypothetical protein
MNNYLLLVEPRHRRSAPHLARMELAVQIVLALLVTLKIGVLASEPRMWSRPDPVLPPLPMALPIIMALSAEAFVLLLLGEREIPPAWKACTLYSLVGVVGAYRISGMILNGINFSGCKCFGIFGEWLTGSPSTLLAGSILALFAFAAWRYTRPQGGGSLQLLHSRA